MTTKRTTGEAKRERGWGPVFDRLAKAHAERGQTEAAESARRAAAKARAAKRPRCALCGEAIR